VRSSTPWFFEHFLFNVGTEISHPSLHFLAFNPTSKRKKKKKNRQFCVIGFIGITKRID